MWCYDAYFVTNYVIMTSKWRNSWRNTRHRPHILNSKNYNFAPSPDHRKKKITIRTWRKWIYHGEKQSNLVVTKDLLKNGWKVAGIFLATRVCPTWQRVLPFETSAFCCLFTTHYSDTFHPKFPPPPPTDAAPKDVLLKLDPIIHLW